jgi:hypothetical protein
MPRAAPSPRHRAIEVRHADLDSQNHSCSAERSRSNVAASAAELTEIQLQVVTLTPAGGFDGAVEAR